MRKYLLIILTVLSLAPMLAGCFYYPYGYDPYDRGYRYDRGYHGDRDHDGRRDGSGDRWERR
ncbi:MAG: hypothetical protein WC899_09360 [bacterium]|jgi:hypothetical protein